MTLILKFDLDMVKMYHHTKNEVSTSRHSKVIAQTDRQYENINFPHTRVVTMKSEMERRDKQCQVKNGEGMNGRLTAAC